MSFHWRTPPEAAEAFTDILNKKWTKLVFADFRLKLSRSILENKIFRNDMKQCGALQHWTDENHLQWVITKKTIQDSLTAIERQYGRTEVIEQPKLEIKLIVEELQSQTDIENPDISAPLVKRAYEPSSPSFVRVAAPRSAYANQESSSSDDDSVNILERKTVAGEPMEILSPRKYIEIEEIIPQPIIEYKEMHPIPLVIPFLVQKIKTWGCNILLPQKLTELFHENEIERQNDNRTISYQELIRSISNSSTSNEIQQHENLAPLCKLDIFSCLIATTDITVLSDLLRILSKFPQTLPLVLPNLDVQEERSASAHIFMYPVLKNCLIRWETADGALAENYLFRSPYKLITAVRLGKNATGKSTILNQLFESSNTFQYRGQPGGERGVPFSIAAGSVEFIWLLENICKASTWTTIQNAQSQSENHKSEIILLANMHGDVNENLDILKAVSPMTSHFLVFVMPDAVKNLHVALNDVATICGEENTSILFVDPPENIRPPEMRVFKTVEIVRDETLQKLNKYIKEGVQSSKSISFSTVGTVKVIDRIETPESQQLLKCIFALSEKKDFQKKGLRDILCLQKISSDTNELWNIWNENEDLRQLMSLFMNVIKLPLKSRRLALGHLENELRILISTKSAKYAKQLRELVQLRNSYKLNPNHVYNIPLSEVYIEMKKIYVELGKSIGLEDLLRELGIVYEMMTSKSTDLQIYASLPEYYAEMLIEGMTLEILDGHLGSITGNWLESVCHSVCKKLPKLKVAVISILGLQSSGKSTLLNALFGCKFAVSVGKCTRGLFMRLMVLEKSYRRKLKIDAIVVVDTEGLGAPENMIDKNAKMKDRMMATFAMTISNLTLINVLGEAKNEITHIMQIVILVMARMDNTDLAPDILLVQHVTEGGQEYKLQQGVSQFCSALDEAVSVSKSEVVNLGVKTLTNLKNIKARIKNQELLAQIRPFKNGASPQSPPTDGYHEDIIKLRRQVIVELTRKSHSQISFCTWHKLLNSYWNAVQTHNFALRFIDIQQVQEYIEVNGRISTVKGNIDSAFLNHQKYLKGHINAKLSTWDLHNDVQSSKHFDCDIQQEIKRVLQFVPYSCEAPVNITSKTSRCRSCLLAITTTHDLMKHVKQTSSISVTETEENLKGYIADLQKTSIARMLKIFESAKIQVGKASEFEKILNDIIKSDIIPEESQSADITWNELLSRVEKLYPIKNVRQQILEDIFKYYIQAPDIHLWQQELNRVPQSDDDPRLTLTIFAAKKRTMLRKRTSLNLTANEHNWLCQKLEGIPQQLIFERNKQDQSYYSPVMIQNHKHDVLNVLRKFEQKYKTKLVERFRWEAILYSVQLLAEKLIQFQHKWNAANEPYLILMGEKVEYLKVRET